jgi:divalent metal cation (Fe/Co/Zn/Cd) transporter
MKHQSASDSFEHSHAPPPSERWAAQQQKWARFVVGSACGMVVGLVGVAWAVADWISPAVSTRDTWALSLAIIVLAQVAGVFAFSLQEFKKVSSRIARAQAE